VFTKCVASDQLPIGIFFPGSSTAAAPHSYLSSTEPLAPIHSPRSPPVERRRAQHFDSFGPRRPSSGRGRASSASSTQAPASRSRPRYERGIVASSASSTRRRSPDADGRPSELSSSPAGSDAATFSCTGLGRSPLFIGWNLDVLRRCNAASALPTDPTSGIGAARLYSLIGVGGHRPPRPVDRTPVRQLSGQSTASTEIDCFARPSVCWYCNYMAIIEFSLNSSKMHICVIK
jgi:hypothetical protein